MRTIYSYKKTILEKYEEGELEYLTELSPAKIRQACLLRFENNLDDTDLNTFARFFNFEEQSTYLEKIKKIEDIDIDKFRPFKNFLKRNTEDTLTKNVELIAVLINFELRPYNKYRKQELEKKRQTTIVSDNVVKIDNSCHKNVSNLAFSQGNIDLEILDGLNAKQQINVNSKNQCAEDAVDLKKTFFIVSIISALFFLNIFTKTHTIINNDIEEAPLVNYIVLTGALYKEESFSSFRGLTTSNQMIYLKKEAVASNDEIMSASEFNISCFEHQGILYVGLKK